MSELTESERSELREELDGSFASSPREWEREWSAELSSRMAQVENGEVELIDGEDVIAELRADLA